MDSQNPNQQSEEDTQGAQPAQPIAQDPAATDASSPMPVPPPPPVPQPMTDASQPQDNTQAGQPMPPVTPMPPAPGAPADQQPSAPQSDPIQQPMPPAPPMPSAPAEPTEQPGAPVQPEPVQAPSAGQTTQSQADMNVQTPPAPEQPQEAPAAPAPSADTAAQTTSVDASAQTAPSDPAMQPAPANTDPTAQQAPADPAQQAQPTGTGGDTMQATAPLPGSPTEHKKGVNLWLVSSIVLLVIVLAASAYFYFLGKNQPAQEVARVAYPTKAVATPTLSVSLSPSPAGTSSAVKGAVTGKLCYPSSIIPAGTITAKNISTNKLYTQAYTGSAAGGGTTYTFPLPAGSYHLKFTPTQYPTVVGYYTDYSSCVGNPSGPNCTGQKVRPVLAATVSATLGAENVNLCDYYYPTNTPPQF